MAIIVELPGPDTPIDRERIQLCRNVVAMHRNIHRHA
eukprot:COSAG01_NODE_63378_length_280_cov_0.806630_1_plen_36_part_10